MASFPTRAFIQTFDELPLAFARLAEEFRSRGIEVVTLTTEEVLAMKPTWPLFTLNDLVVGDFDWTRMALKQLGIPMPEPPDYPKCLQHLLHRKIWQTTLGDVPKELEALEIEAAASGKPKNIFIKPASDTKAFSAIIEPKDQMLSSLLTGIPGVWEPHPPSLPVHCAEVVSMISEYRVYVAHGKIRGICHYGNGPEDGDGALDCSVVEEAVRILAESEEGRDSVSAGCGMDFAVLRKPREVTAVEGDDTEGECVTCLVEVNDGYSLGVYDGLSAKDHADLLIGRWAQLLKSRK